MDAVNQHYVPQFLLKRFAKNGQMSAYDLETKNTRLVPVRRSAARDHFYRIEIPGEDPNNDIERYLGMVEGLAAGAISRLVDKHIWPVSDEDRATLAGFTALQSVRTFKTRAMIDAVTDTTVKMEFPKATRED